MKDLKEKGRQHFYLYEKVLADLFKKKKEISLSEARFKLGVNYKIPKESAGVVLKELEALGVLRKIPRKKSIFFHFQQPQTNNKHFKKTRREKCF